MPTSEVEICNRAIGRVGVDQLIESLEDPNNRARNCKLQYEPCRDEVLADFPWNFAQTCIALAPVANLTIPGWRHVYRYPADCVQVHRVTGPEGQRLLGVNWAYDVWNYDVMMPTRNPFSVMNDPTTAGAKIIVTDVDTAFAWYTAKVTSPGQFSELFRSALAWRIAMELALSLRANNNLYNNAAQQYGWSVSQAQVHSLGEETTDRQPMPAAVQARF